MIDKIKELLKKVKNFFKETQKKLKKKTKPFFKDLSKLWEVSSLDKKILLALYLVLAIDLSFFISSYSSYSQNPTVKLMKGIQSDLKKNKNVDSNSTVDIQNNYNTITSGKKVYFVEDGKKQNVTVFVRYEDKNVTKISGIPKFSIVQNLEPLLMKEKVPFYWVNVPKKPTLPISSFVASHLFGIILIGGLIFLLLQTSDISLGGKSFDKVYPKDIKGSMKNIIGYDDVKEEILQLKELIKKRNKYKLYGIEDVFNILLTGKPGTGKSKMAGFICKSLNIPMVVTTGNVDSKFVGSGVKHIRSVFSTAEKMAQADKSKSCIIFIDEGQGLLVRRGKHDDNKWADDSANELLAHLDGVKTNKDINIIVIVASNFNENNFDMDEAMARRFKKKIHFRDPNIEERREIIKHYLKKVKSKEKNIDIDFIAKNTSGLTPAIIETIIQEAGLISLKKKEKVNTENIMKAFENVLIGQSDRKTTKDKEAMRKVITIHEMGHFIIDFHKYMVKNGDDIEETKKDIKLLKVSSEAISRTNSLGYVLSEQEDIALQSISQLEDEIQKLYGGVAAEELFYGKAGITTGSFDDIEKVTRILEHLVYETGSYVNYKLNLSNLDLKTDESEELLKEKSENLYNDTLDILRSYKGLIEHLSEILMDKWVLTKDEIFEEIEIYYEMNSEEL